ncbi:MAG: hypothetical protein Q7S27_03315 [Nanoarchaeota archaeon]|nr:hypothetical protein [Nanoarchaeota archaeon]
MKKRGYYKLEKKFAPFEKFTDKIIPYLALLLAFLIIAEFTINDIEKYRLYITIIDYIIVSFFVLDLIFKWIRIHKFKRFVRLYWLDLLAVFPFYLIIRIYLRIATLIKVGEEIAEIQKFAHEAVVLREAKVLESLEKEAKVVKDIKPTVRFIRSIQKILRIRRAKIALTLKSAVHIHAKNQNYNK